VAVTGTFLPYFRCPCSDDPSARGLCRGRRKYAKNVPSARTIGFHHVEQTCAVVEIDA